MSRQKSNSRKPSRSRGRSSKSTEKTTEALEPQVEAEAVEAQTDAVEEQIQEADKQEMNQFKGPFAQWTQLSEELLQGIAGLGFENPTAVQSAAVEPALQKRNMVVQAKTGTGKTAAFSIPLVQNLETSGKKPKAMVLAPTRELARQVADVVEGLGKYKKTRVLAVYGGIRLNVQIRHLEEGVDVIVGSPGRLLDLIQRGHLDVSEIKTVVLDEADEMLSQGFYEDVTSLIEQCSNREQLMLFSATIPDGLERLVNKYLPSPYRLMVEGRDRRVEGIHHVAYFKSSELTGPRNLLYVLENEKPNQAIIFCNQRGTCEMVSNYLAQQGKNARAVHGDMDQLDREAVFQLLKEGEIQFMVATDLAARGIDVSGLECVIIFDDPATTETYLHRGGRTGRQGRSGVAISMLGGKAIGTLHQLRTIHNLIFEFKDLPPAQDIIRKAASSHIEKIFHEATTHVIEDFLPLADVVAEDPRGRFIFSYLLKLYHHGALKNDESKANEGGEAS